MGCGRGRGGGGAVGTIRKALVYELLLASLCKQLLVHFYLLFESDFLSTCKCWSQALLRSFANKLFMKMD